MDFESARDAILKAKNKWLGLLMPVPPVTEFSDPIVPTHNATGCDASKLDAVVSDCQNDQTDGSDHQELAIMAINEIALRYAETELHDAVEKYMRAMYGPLTTVDFLILADNVQVDEGKDVHVLHPGWSSNMTAWKMNGIGITGLRFFVNAGI